MASQQLLRNFIADGAIPQYSLVKLGSDAKHIALATGPTDNVIGISASGPAAGNVAGDRVDVTMIGIDRCVAGATFTYGVALTSDGSGRVVAAAPAAGVNNRLIGVALADCTTVGDVVEVLISQGSIQG